MRKMILAGLFAITIAAPACAAEWRNLFMDFDIDLQSVKPEGAGFVATFRHTDLAREGLPPPAASAVQRYRYDCAAHTSQAIDIFYYGKDGKELPGGGPYPDPARQTMVDRPGSVPDRVEKMICPTLPAR